MNRFVWDSMDGIIVIKKNGTKIKEEVNEG